ncbi:MAG: hypothetical protein U0787_20160 [Polyangia bacterium]
MSPDKLREAECRAGAKYRGVLFQRNGRFIGRIDGGDRPAAAVCARGAGFKDVRQGSRITAKALESIGGVMGALARHADHLIGSLPAERRPLARRLLMSLVTIDGTRARRTAEELTWNDASTRACSNCWCVLAVCWLRAKRPRNRL